MEDMKMVVECSLDKSYGDGSPPTNIHCEYFGWGQGMIFWVGRPRGTPITDDNPSEEWDVKDLILMVGHYEKEDDIRLRPGEEKEITLERVPVLSASRSDREIEVEGALGVPYTVRDRETLNIEIEGGNFYLPCAWARQYSVCGKEKANFNGCPIEIVSD